MKLTVIIRDDGPMIHCGDSPSYRSVQLNLTDEQVVALSRRQTHSSGGVEYFEQYSRCFIEVAPQSAEVKTVTTPNSDYTTALENELGLCLLECDSELSSHAVRRIAERLNSAVRTSHNRERCVKCKDLFKL